MLLKKKNFKPEHVCFFQENTSYHTPITLHQIHIDSFPCSFVATIAVYVGHILGYVAR